MTPRKPPEERLPLGRPSLYKPEYAGQVFKLCLLDDGMTDKQIADFFGVSEVTLNAWKAEHPDFLKSLLEGKEKADAEVAHGLYQNAVGAEWTEQQAIKIRTGKDQEKVEIVEVKRKAKPDTGAASMWLSNRRRGKWRSQQPSDLPLPPPPSLTVNVHLLARKIAFVLASGINASPALPVTPSKGSDDNGSRQSQPPSS